MAGNDEQIINWNAPGSRMWWEDYAAIDERFDAFTEEALDHAAIARGERVIDIGCATGTTVMKLARRVGPDGWVTGVDISENSVGVGRQRLAEAGLTNAQIELADAAAASFDQGGYDLVFSRFGVMFFVDPVAAFANIRRGLKPGGRAQFIAFRRPEENAWATGPRQVVAAILPPEPPVDPNAPGQFAWADAHRDRAILEAAGFTGVTVTPHDTLLRMAGPGTAGQAAEQAMRFGPVGRLVASLDGTKQDEARRRLVDYFADKAGPDGVMLPAALWFVSARNPG